MEPIATKHYALKVTLELRRRLMEIGPDKVREALAALVGSPELAKANKPGRPKSKKVLP
jgi:hypothetical protein